MKKLFILSLMALTSLNAKSIETTNPGLQCQTKTHKPKLKGEWKEIAIECGKENFINALGFFLLTAFTNSGKTWKKDTIDIMSTFATTGALSKLILHQLKPINETSEPLNTKNICKNIAFETFSSLISTSAATLTINKRLGPDFFNGYPRNPLILATTFLAIKAALSGSTIAHSKFKKSSSKDKEANIA